MAIVLGTEYEAGAITPAEYLSAGIRSDALPDVLVIGAAPEARAAALALPDRVAVLWLVDEPASQPDTALGGHTMARRFLPEELRRRIATLTSTPHHRDPARRLSERLHTPHLPP